MLTGPHGLSSDLPQGKTIVFEQEEMRIAGLFGFGASLQHVTGDSAPSLAAGLATTKVFDLHQLSFAELLAN